MQGLFCSVFPVSYSDYRHTNTAKLHKVGGFEENELQLFDPKIARAFILICNKKRQQQSQQLQQLQGKEKEEEKEEDKEDKEDEEAWKKVLRQELKALSNENSSSPLLVLYPGICCCC